MDFRIDDDLAALRDGFRALLDARLPAGRLVELDASGGFDAALFGELAKQGLFAMRLPEPEGGLGLGWAETLLLHAELGRRLVPGPLLWTQLAAGLVPGAATGACVVTGLDRTRASAHELVAHLAVSNAVLVLAPDGVFRADTASLDAEPVETPLDPHVPLHRVHGFGALERIGDAGAVTRLRAIGAALAAAELLGISEGAQQLATAYAKERHQFGRPIGGFQAVKHLLADAWVRSEVARPAVLAAGATLDDPAAGDLARAVAGAKWVATRAARENARCCIQVHGGMGYTWEVPAHRYWKRARVLEPAFGASAEQAERVAERMAEA